MLVFVTRIKQKFIFVINEPPDCSKTDGDDDVFQILNLFEMLMIPDTASLKKDRHDQELKYLPSTVSNEKICFIAYI